MLSFSNLIVISFSINIALNNKQQLLVINRLDKKNIKSSVPVQTAKKITKAPSTSQTKFHPYASSQQINKSTTPISLKDLFSSDRNNNCSDIANYINQRHTILSQSKLNNVSQQQHPNLTESNSNNPSIFLQNSHNHAHNVSQKQHLNVPESNYIMILQFLLKIAIIITF